jgi:hypothetical protein
MERDGRITAEMRLAGDRFHDLFVPAALDPRPIRRESRRKHYRRRKRWLA